MDACIISFNLNCIMQSKQFYNIATKFSCRKKVLLLLVINLTGENSIHTEKAGDGKVYYDICTIMGTAYFVTDTAFRVHCTFGSGRTKQQIYMLLCNILTDCVNRTEYPVRLRNLRGLQNRLPTKLIEIKCPMTISQYRTPIQTLCNSIRHILISKCVYMLNENKCSMPV